MKLIPAHPPDRYLESSRYIDSNHPSIIETANALQLDSGDEEAIVSRSFEFVRDTIKHSNDYQMNPITCTASDVLLHGTGYCYAKSHLLAALLRCQGIPTGLCYQRLSVSDSGPPYCLHGLNAVFLKKYGWYRLDARGNKPGVDAQFCPPQEALAFAIREDEECDLPEIWAEPRADVTAVLERYDRYDLVAQNLPDIDPV